ncbi:hypothetical protein B296_00041562 [Ensete ventricosum]|uniref:Uncharacterized protein n=1 Tax=Ensete ventricosum TaxID=4639 RepID=A0A426X091_ENSVE|nr:hypothetical protein B296_00041562 [Ensete ventricosum]
MDQRMLGGADRSGDPNKGLELMRRQKVEHQEQRWTQWNNGAFERDEARSSGRREKTNERGGGRGTGEKAADVPCARSRCPAPSIRT